MNLWHFTGNLGKDAVQRFTQNNTPVSNFSVAVQAGYGQNEQTVWANCAIFGKRAESLTQYLTRGTKVAVAGELKVRQWTNNQSEIKFEIWVDVKEITLMGSPQQNQSSGQGDIYGSYPQQGGGHQPPPQPQPHPQQHQPQHQPQQQPSAPNFIDDDIPF